MLPLIGWVRSAKTLALEEQHNLRSKGFEVCM